MLKNNRKKIDLLIKEIEIVKIRDYKMLPLSLRSDGFEWRTLFAYPKQEKEGYCLGVIDLWLLTVEDFKEIEYLDLYGKTAKDSTVEDLYTRAHHTQKLTNEKI